MYTTRIQQLDGFGRTPCPDHGVVARRQYDGQRILEASAKTDQSGRPWVNHVGVVT